MNTEKWYNNFKTDLQQKYSSESTLKSYNRCVYLFLNHFKEYREPKEIPTQKIKEYLLTYKTHNTRKQHLCSVRKFYEYTVKMPKKVSKIPYPKKVKKLPRVIDSKYVNEVINGVNNIKHKTIIAFAYDCALRRSEVINFKIENIDRKRMLLLIENAKGCKDRYVKLSPELLLLFEQYYKKHKPKKYLFNGQSKNTLKYSASSYNNVVKKYFGEEYSTHHLRHSGCTAMHEQGVDLATLSLILGHNSVKTTEIYTHVSTRTLQNSITPLNLKQAI